MLFRSLDRGALAGVAEVPAEVREALRPGEAVAAGAELVQLGLTDERPDAVVQRQDPMADDGPERADLLTRLSEAARMLRTEVFPARAGEHCRDCDFVPLCPVRSAGAVTA